jgi:hypothetical protein
VLSSVLLSLVLPHTVKDKKPLKLIVPPGTIQIDSNLFIDKAEISNSNYLEYVYWIYMVYGGQSMKYKKALPDTAVWSNITVLLHDKRLKALVKYYFRNRMYANYPVVGISYEQAIEFSNWRADRVFEQFLMKNGKLDKKPRTGTFFTIEKYFTNKYPDCIPDSSLSYPIYALPSYEQWTQALFFQEVENKPNQKSCKAKSCPDLLLLDSMIIRCLETVDWDPVDIRCPLTETCCPDCKKDVIFHLQGNASEMSSEYGKSLGGGWTDTLGAIKNTYIYNYAKPNAWTGFRNSCRWKKFENGDF